MMKNSKKIIAIMLTLLFVLGMMPSVIFAATLGGVTLEDTALSITETFDTWTTIKDAYNGTNGTFKHRYTGNNTTSRRQPAINELAYATADMAPYKAAGDSYLDFRMMGGSEYTNRYGTTPTDTSNLVASPRIYVESKAAVTNTVDEKLHVSFEIMADDMNTVKVVKYCDSWSDHAGMVLVEMGTSGMMQIGPSTRFVTMPYKADRWYKFDFVFDFGGNTTAYYVDGNKVYEYTSGKFEVLLEEMKFLQFILSGAAKDMAEGQSSALGIDNLTISLHKATDEITIDKKQGLPAYELGTATIPAYEFGTEGNYTAEIPCTLFDLGQSAQIVVASYNPDGSLDNVSVGTSVASDTMARGKALTSTAKVSETANRIKVFLLENMETIVPIIPETEISQVNP